MYRIDRLSFNWLILKNHNIKVQKYLNKISGVVYDFGCGTKPYEEDILKIADKYIGIDWSNTPHELKADIVADLNEKLPLDDAVADTVISYQVMEHLREPQNMLNEAHRVLKKDGNIFLTVPFQWWIHEAPYDYYRYTQYGLKYMFEKAGFRDIHIEPHGGFFTMWLLKLNYFSLRFIRDLNF
jgi:SAM-dependent methyltransferase